MTANLTANPVTADQILDARDQLRRTGANADQLVQEFEDIFTAIGGSQNPSLHVESAHDDAGKTYTDVRFLATSRYTVDGVRYVLGEGIRFNYDSVIDNLKAIANHI